MKIRETREKRKAPHNMGNRRKIYAFYCSSTRNGLSKSHAKNHMRVKKKKRKLAFKLEKPLNV